MGLNDLTSAERPHISFFGRRNAGKSSVVNAVTNQKLSIVSDTLGTTTDPVKKAMEIMGFSCGKPRLPLVECDKATETALVQILRQFGI